MVINISGLELGFVELTFILREFDEPLPNPSVLKSSDGRKPPLRLFAPAQRGALSSLLSNEKLSF
ncbi:hypothetical protein NIES4103_51580 [Nostoc sp. NIES-4103]|nr:hypothetical protein NIES4103_51580 [Nostoc sp. NIES-4103]